MNLQWYPGHMAKTRRLIEENVKLIDIVVEIMDARVPVSSRNPDFDVFFSTKPRIALLNKTDLADAAATEKWVAWYKKRGIEVICVNALAGKGTEKIPQAARLLLKDKIEKNAERGLTKSIKMMVVGIPKVGKSSLINRLCKKAAAKTGDRPGVTKGKQWLRLREGIEILDTPGILWPKFEDERVGMHLAFIGSIRDEIMDTETLCCHLLESLKLRYADKLCARYKLDGIDEADTGYDILQKISKKRGFVISGGELDTERGARVVLDEFRSATIGQITLELPEDIEGE